MAGPRCVIRHPSVFTLTGIHIFYLEHGIDFRLRRYALKIMSFVISANKLFMLSLSRRLRNLLYGEFSVQVLPSLITTPYCCDLSPETMQVALDAAWPQPAIVLRHGMSRASRSFSGFWRSRRVLRGWSVGILQSMPS